MKILIADDHPMYLEALTVQVRKAYPETGIVTAGTMDDTRTALQQSGFALVLLDFRMPGMKGVDSVADLVAAAGSCPLVVMSGVAEPPDVAGCVKAGARGFLPKTLDGSVFASALGTILAGGTYLPTDYLTAGDGLDDSRSAGSLKKSDFTPREFDVLTRLARGASNKEIARELGLQEVTVKLHLTRIFAKMGVRNRSQAAVLAVSSDLVG